ncbi:MAG TPA: potassium channel family protein [Candidatus Limnocylindrales bacterium]|nr:potassium channel family protein [Candidatus Limnocylindrales bacterium]
MNGLSWVQIGAGFALLLVVFADLFQSVVLPRPAVNKFALVRYLLRGVWRAWRWVGSLMRSVARREGWLAVFGPIGVLLQFGVWAAGLVLGYALVFDGLRTQMHPAIDSFGSALYFSATTLVPLSYGDLVPIGIAARVVTIGESATGVFLAALAITLLFSLYAAFQEREELVVTLDAMAGAPPSGVRILETAAEHGMRRELTETFDEWRHWAAAVLESHLAYPILLFFRSSHDNEAWLNSFGAVMDAAILVISTIDDESEGPAQLMLTVGNHLVEDISWYFRLRASRDPYVERQEFDEALQRLARAGYHCRRRETAWEAFVALRARYAFPLNQLAKRLAIIPAQWIGDRSYLPHRER